jgi:hypothetical protein
MTLYHFLGLTTNEQADFVWQGAYLATRPEGDHQILLYSLDEFYAEVFYDTKANAITRIKGFRSRSLLMPYINLVNFNFR